LEFRGWIGRTGQPVLMSTSTKPTHNQFWSSPGTQPYPHDGNENACPTPANLKSNQGSCQACTNAMACTGPMNHAKGELPRYEDGAREWFTWRKMAIGMMFLWSLQWRVEICSKIQTRSQTWVCLSHHYGVICIALHNLEKEAKQGSYKKKWRWH